jgi:hypothetical protein
MRVSQNQTRGGTMWGRNTTQGRGTMWGRNNTWGRSTMWGR